MFSSKNKAVPLFLIVLSSLLVSTAIFAVDKRELSSAQKANFQPRDISSQNEVNGFFKPSRWGNDVTIATGSVSGGISTDYDTAGNLYAVRCTTWSTKGVSSEVIVYRSTNNGTSWSPFCNWGPFVQTFAYPVILTGSSGGKLYVFVWVSQNDGDIFMARFNTLFGGFETSAAVAPEADTISYFTACTNMGRGDTLVVVYQKDRTSGTPYLYSTMSTDYGVNWSTPQMQSGDGEHPDIAYGQAGNVYLTYHKTIKDDIAFLRGKTYETGPWDYLEFLTNDSTSHHDDFPKIAALHTLPADTTTVWVVYNHDEPPLTKVTNTDLRFAYSTNSGVDWTKDQVLANDPFAQEMAADLEVYRSSTNQYVDLCYLKYSGVVKSGSDIYYTWAEAKSPEQFSSPHQIINEHWANWSPDGREVCQLIYPFPDWYPGIVYAGAPTPKDGAGILVDGAWNLYYDYYGWTDVEEETEEEKSPAEFFLSNNYPNPFNPETKIGYFIPKACQVKLEVFNILGQRVRTLVDQVQTTGKKEVTWDGKDENGNEIASGVYFYKLEAEGFTQTKKMVLMK